VVLPQQATGGVFMTISLSPALQSKREHACKAKAPSKPRTTESITANGSIEGHAVKVPHSAPSNTIHCEKIMHQAISPGNTRQPGLAHRHAAIKHPQARPHNLRPQGQGEDTKKGAESWQQHSRSCCVGH